MLAPRFSFTTKASGPQEGFDHGKKDYNPDKCNMGLNETSGQVHIEIKGLAQPKSQGAKRICQEDLNALITPFVQDRISMERGLFDEELVPEELTQVPMGKII